MAIGGKRGLLFGEHVHESVSLRLGARRHFPIIFHPRQLEYSLIHFDDMSKYTLTKIYSTMFAKTPTSSLPCGSATWTFNNNVFVQSNVSKKIYQGWCPMCWSKKMSLVHFLRILPLSFKHVLHVRVLSDIKSIFYIAKGIFEYFAMSFVVVVMGDKLNMNLSTKHKW